MCLLSVLFGHLLRIDMNFPKAIGIIPARYGSTRLPGKPLVDIGGIPLICRVWNAASSSKLLDSVIIASDDERIKQVCTASAAPTVMTSGDIKSGSDRIIAALDSIDGEYDYIVNIQGDEPFITGELIDTLLRKTIDSGADVGTVVCKIENKEELFDSSVVKVVLRTDDTALYFSRSLVPYVRDANADDLPGEATFWKHIGIYCYKREALLKFGKLPQSDLEIAEKLEQLRLLQDGASYVCLKTDIPLYGVDTKEDLEKVREILAGNKSLS